MLQIRRDADLAEEPLAAKHRAELWVEHFERDETLVFDVAGEIDGRHPAPPELAFDRVRRRERAPELVQSLGRRKHCVDGEKQVVGSDERPLMHHTMQRRCLSVQTAALSFART